MKTEKYAVFLVLDEKIAFVKLIYLNLEFIYFTMFNSIFYLIF